MAGTLGYTISVRHVFQRKFGSDELGNSMSGCHWYIISRRPRIRILEGSPRIKDGILTLEFIETSPESNTRRTFALGSELIDEGNRAVFKTYDRGSYFSLHVDGRVIHGDAWALASLFSAADRDVAKQEVLYIGQAFAGGHGNAWERTSHHQKLQMIYEDHASDPWDIFVSPLILQRGNFQGDDHIDDSEDGPSLERYLSVFSGREGTTTKTSIDLVEHSLISYFNPPYNEQLRNWNAANPTTAMRKMRDAGFRLLHVHLSGWQGLSRFYSEEQSEPNRSHFISQDIPPAPRRPVLRGVSAQEVSDWRDNAKFIEEGSAFFANMAEGSGVELLAFGNDAPKIRKPAPVRISESHQLADETSQEARGESLGASHDQEEVHRKIMDARRARSAEKEALTYKGEATYDGRLGVITIGLDRECEPVHWSLHDSKGTVANGLILGTDGQGKSSLLRVIAHQALLSKRFSPVLVRPDGSDPTHEAALKQLSEVAKEVDIRLVSGPKHESSKRNRGIICALDDSDKVLGYPGGRDLILKILTQGPALGVGMVMVIRDPDTLRLCPDITKDLITSTNRVAFMENADAVLNALDTEYGERRKSSISLGRPTFMIFTSGDTRFLTFVSGFFEVRASHHEARAFATQLIQEAQPDSPLLGEWKPLSEDHDAWAYSAEPMLTSWFLHKHPDRWIISCVLASFRPVREDSLADSIEWADFRWHNRFEGSLGPWRIGPTAASATGPTLYADALSPFTFKDQSQNFWALQSHLFGSRPEQSQGSRVGLIQ
ncbi:hypothetical protein [Streptomonospora salina]|uniref:Uncharacterized protein n=1 Tax=Streptomonospora salina TaxID=104205 RepID=A0A841EGJ6_9ACTN|nr:hypothetical protein [Streptomonospora salina]MBB6000143.1 hypothetical protein [Streptomonospora salina]